MTIEVGYGEDFLPPGYETPEVIGKYCRPGEESLKVRALARPIFGMEGWTEDAKGNRKPVRKRPGEEFRPGEIIIGKDSRGQDNNARHFWALPVWNYKAGTIQILQITQSLVQKQIEALSKNPSWGNPMNYDIVIAKVSDKPVRYQVTPEPKTPLHGNIIVEWGKVRSNFNIELLYSNGDPFEANSATAQPSSEVPFPEPSAAPAKPSLPNAVKFGTLLKKTVEMGIYSADVLARDQAGADARLKIVRELSTNPNLIINQMNDGEWAFACAVLENVIARNTPPATPAPADDDIPF